MVDKKRQMSSTLVKWHLLSILSSHTLFLPQRIHRINPSYAKEYDIKLGQSVSFLGDSTLDCST